MLYYLIPGIIIALSAGILLFLVGRKFSLLRTLDLAAMRSHQQAQAKSALLENRLYRRLAEIKKAMLEKLRPLFKRIFTFVKKVFSSLTELERKYRHQGIAQKAQTQETKEALRQNLNIILANAQVHLEKAEYHEAEKKYIEVVGLDAQNIEAYQGLAEVYAGLKDFAHALETLEFAKKLDPENAELWVDLGCLYQKLDNPKQVQSAFKKAVEISPNNPKYLDLLLAQSIINKDRYEATRAFDKLKEVNPDNQKLGEYQQQLASM